MLSRLGAQEEAPALGREHQIELSWGKGSGAEWHLINSKIPNRVGMSASAGQAQETAQVRMREEQLWICHLTPELP